MNNKMLALLKQVSPVCWMRVFLYGFLVLGIYYSALAEMVLKDWAREDYSHCYLIPFLVFYLIWEKRNQFISQQSVATWIGFIPVTLGILLYWLGELGGETFTIYISFWLVIVGLCLLHFGWQKIKTIWFALFMLLAMFPYPYFVTVRLSLYLKLISSQIGVWLLQLYGMSAYREGNIIDLGFTQLQVVDACSGLRYLISLMVLALILAYWFKAQFWKKAVLFLSSIPIAIFVNSFRIALTGVLYSFIGAAAAEGFFHGFSGWLIFIFTLGILLIEMWILKRIGKKFVQSEEKGKALAAERVPAEETRGIGRGLLQPHFLAALGLLGLTLVFSYGVEFREKIAIAKPLNQFPLQIAEWTGTRQTMEQKFIDVLDFSDYTIIDYKNPQGQTVNFYVAYYETQRKGESIHSPETCLPGSGWEFKEAGLAPVAWGNKSAIRVSRSFMVSGDTQQLVYYWFPQRGRILTSLYQLKFYAFWDALTKQRNDGALIRIITPVYPAENRKTAEARLHGFTREIAPLIDQFIPGSDVQR